MGTNNPVSGATVNFSYSSSGGVFSGQVLEQQKTTDVNGRVSFKGQKEKELYQVKVLDGNDYFGETVNNINEGHHRLFLKTSPYAYVRVHAKNVTPYDNNDWFIISNGQLGGGGVLYGMNVDTIVVRGPFKGTGNGEFGWVVKKNNISTTYTVQLYFVGRDTINYSIEY